MLCTDVTCEKGWPHVVDRGIYSGREENTFWRRVRGDPDCKVEAAGAKALCEKDTELLRPDIIHSVTNPISEFTAALHVYGGDFFGVPRSEWDPDTLREKPYSIEEVARLFEESNRKMEDAV